MDERLDPRRPPRRLPGSASEKDGTEKANIIVSIDSLARVIDAHAARLKLPRTYNNRLVAISPSDSRYPSTMEVTKMIAELRQERDQIEHVIASLERLALGGRKRRGRPPAWLKEAAATTVVKRRGRPPGSKNKPKEE